SLRRCETAIRLGSWHFAERSATLVSKCRPIRESVGHPQSRPLESGFRSIGAAFAVRQPHVMTTNAIAVAAAMRSSLIQSTGPRAALLLRPTRGSSGHIAGVAHNDLS